MMVKKTLFKALSLAALGYILMSQDEPNKQYEYMQPEQFKILKTLNYGNDYFDTSDERSRIIFKGSTSLEQSIGDTYFLLINADKNPLDTTRSSVFVRNMDYAIDAAKSLGVSKKNIFVLGSNGFRETNLEDIDWTFRILSRRIKKNDTFFLYITQHGFYEQGESYISLNDGNRLSLSHINDLMSDINSSYNIVFLPPCMSFDGAYKISNEKTTCITASGPRLNAIGGFSRIFFNSLKALGKKASLKDVFDNSVKWDYYTIPLFNDKEFYESGMARINSERRRKETPHIITRKDPSEIYFVTK